MSEKHQLVLDFIKAYMRLHKVSPSYQVIANGIGLKSKSNIHRIIHALEDEGLLTVKAYKFNSIRVLDKGAREVLDL
jgi:repressor LexA